MIVEGRNCAIELIKANYPVEKVIVCKETGDKIDDIIALAKNKNINIEITNKKNIEKIAKSSHCQGVLSFVKPYEYCYIEDILQKAKDNEREPFILILDGIEDPHNVGALIRTAECLGVDGIIIPKNRACEINETVFKTSVGAVAHMLVAQVVNISQTIEKLKEKNIWCYALEAGEKDIISTDLTGGVALVVGSEGRGVSKLVAKTCDATISIPMFGKINSLNASNAGAIAMYEVLRQRTISKQ